MLSKFEDMRFNVVIMVNVEYRDLKNVVEFIYKGEVNVMKGDLKSFMRTAEFLGITGLTDPEIVESFRPCASTPVPPYAYERNIPSAITIEKRPRSRNQINVDIPHNNPVLNAALTMPSSNLTLSGPGNMKDYSYESSLRNRRKRQRKASGDYTIPENGNICYPRIPASITPVEPTRVSQANIEAPSLIPNTTEILVRELHKRNMQLPRDLPINPEYLKYQMSRDHITPQLRNLQLTRELQLLKENEFNAQNQPSTSAGYSLLDRRPQLTPNLLAKACHISPPLASPIAESIQSSLEYIMAKRNESVVAELNNALKAGYKRESPEMEAIPSSIPNSIVRQVSNPYVIPNESSNEQHKKSEAVQNHDEIIVNDEEVIEPPEDLSMSSRTLKSESNKDESRSSSELNQSKEEKPSSPESVKDDVAQKTSSPNVPASSASEHGSSPNNISSNFGHAEDSDDDDGANIHNDMVETVSGPSNSQSTPDAPQQSKYLFLQIIKICFCCANLI